MAVYFILFGMPIAWNIFCSVAGMHSKRVKNISIILFFSFLILLIGFRSIKVGNDTDEYLYYYNRIGSVDFTRIFSVSSTQTTSMEHGFVLLVWLFNLINAPFNIFLLFCATVSLVPLMILFYRESKYPILSISLFVGVSPFTMFFSGVRQSMAMGIGVICFILAKNRRLFLFLMLIFLAYFIHQSSVVLLLLYPLAKLKIKKEHLLFIVFLGLLVIFFGSYILKIGYSFLGHYGHYEIASTGAYRMIVLLFIFIAICFFIPSNNTNNSSSLFEYRNILCICFVLQCFTRHSFVATRIVYYFAIFIPLAIDSTISNPKKENKDLSLLLNIGLQSFFIVYFFVDAYFGNDGLNIFPYSPFWSIA